MQISYYDIHESWYTTCIYSGYATASPRNVAVCCLVPFHVPEAVYCVSCKLSSPVTIHTYMSCRYMHIMCTTYDKVLCHVCT